jgi:hypothetical protein
MRHSIFRHHLALAACACLAVLAPCAAEEPPRASAGAFSANDLPADRDAAVLLTIPRPGRYAIAARSASGAALQLVDMIAGPGDVAGAAGLRDGRLDLILDKGVYKLRVLGAKGAGGKVRLTALPFEELQKKSEALAPGRSVAAELGDLTQRTYSVEVGPSGRIALEALGRSLRDLRLWRTSGELVDLAPARDSVEPRAGRPMTRLRLEGAVAPGRYLVTAYGGEPIVWAEGGAAQPVLLRHVEEGSLAAGVVEGVIGPFGSARFEAPAGDDAFRLELAKPLAARLEARRGTGAPISAWIAKTSREPIADLALAADGKTAARVEVSGPEGLAFTLRGLRRASRAIIEGSGTHLVALDVAGEGADEVPATALLARIENNRARVIASDLPKIGAGRTFRARFNLRGATTLLFEVADSGRIAIGAKGPRLRALIEPAFGAAAPRADGRAPTQYDLQAGFYSLSLEPVEGAAGIVDLTLGPPGLTPDSPSPPPARTAISFGEQVLDKAGSYLILANSAPGLMTGPRVVALPADLEKGPAALWRPAMSDFLLPVRAPRAGQILIIDENGASAPAEIAEEKIDKEARFATVRLPAAARAQALAVVHRPEPRTANAPEATTERPPLTFSASKPAWFDLARDERRELRFEAPVGGLYRVETLGRLKTRLTLGADATPRLGEAEDNGPGHNALVLAYLRAGAYRAAVTARESAGHLGLSVKPVAMATTAPILGEGAARAVLDGGRGALVPIEIEEAGLYRLDLQGLGRGLGKQWRARLEEADGWPLTTPGPIARLVRRFEPGAYRLVALPEAVEGRVLARLRKVVASAPLEGHGPHALPFDAPQALQWREPTAKGAPRAPDVWTFALAGDSDIDIDIGEGMIGEIFREGGDAVGKFAAGRKFSGKLAAGAYRIEARSLAHDDRLDYRIGLSSKQLQPGAPRFVTPPAVLPFAIGEDRIVDVTSFGDQELIGALEDENGAVVERLEGRAEDWNISLSRRLPAGAYRLRLDALESRSRGETSDGETESVAGESEPDDQSASGTADPKGVEIRFSLPASAPGEALDFAGARTVSGPGAHELALPAATPGRLMVVAAQSAREIALSIETRGDGGRWRVIGQERGLAPVAAWPAAEGDWRAVVWTIGGAGAPITLAARSLGRPARGLGAVTLEPAPIEGLATRLCVGLASAPAAALVEIGAATTPLAAGSTPGRLLAPTGVGALAPQSESLWLLSREDCRIPARITPFTPSGAEIPLTLGVGERAVLPAAPAPSGKARLWLARSAFGQPGVAAGRGFAVAPGAALALAGTEPPRLWNASGAEPLRLTAQAVDVSLAAPIRAEALFVGVIPPFTAQPVSLAGAGASLSLDLAAGLAAFAAPQEARPFAVFADGASLSRRLEGPRALWLVNLSSEPAPARVALAPERYEPLAAGRIAKRFFGAAGEVSHKVEAEPGDLLVVAGGEATFIGATRVIRGRSLRLDGPGEVTIAHGPGHVAAWIERAGKSPWPKPEPRVVTAPVATPVAGEAQAFALDLAAPAVLDIRASAPALVAVTQGAREAAVFPAGVEMHRYAGPGRALVEIVSPHDGPLSGTLTIATTPVIPASDGLNEPVALGPGATALFTFEVRKAGEIGLGLRAEPDRAELRLLDASGRVIGEGAAQIARLEPGRYFAEARAPADAPATTLRLALRGLSPPLSGPPPEVVAELLEKARRK